ncbi:MAG: radical SAM protein [Promethearchaeota archaeon]
MENNYLESPDHVQTSMAGAITLGFEKGFFYRDAKLYCLNLLLTYKDGCRANCAFCGLGRERQCSGSNQDKTFIRVKWPVYPIDSIVDALKSPRCKHVKRSCISMVTHPRARDDTFKVITKLRATGKDISVLIAPTVIDKQWLVELNDLGIDKVGIAIDAATPRLFEKLRGKGVNGPHRWEKYWSVLKDAIEVFGGSRTGIHLIVGLGETERECVQIMQKVFDIGSTTHLFSFFPEPGSKLELHPQPGIGTYRRVQLARELLERGLTSIDKMEFNEQEQIIDFGMAEDLLDTVIMDGSAFLTQGCKDEKGFITCNRPFSNCTPFQAAKGETRNFPFPPNADDLVLIKRQLRNYDTGSWVRPLEFEEDFIIDEV